MAIGWLSFAFAEVIVKLVRAEMQQPQRFIFGFCFWMANLFYTKWFNMGFIEDDDIWNEYKKSVEKIDRKNIFTPEIKISRKQNFAIKTNRTQNSTVEFMNNRRSFKDVDIINLNKKDRKKFRSEATIDLHGYTRKVDSTLEMFCSKCIVSNVKDITIISGKGEGIVKAAVLHWLNNHSEYVIGFFEIKDTLGESGAFGVKLRSK